MKNIKGVHRFEKRYVVDGRAYRKVAWQVLCSLRHFNSAKIGRNRKGELFLESVSFRAICFGLNEVCLVFSINRPNHIAFFSETLKVVKREKLHHTSDFRQWIRILEKNSLSPSQL